LLVTTDAISLCQGFENTDPKELKVALSNFIERIDVEGTVATLNYTFMKPATVIVHDVGDPGGI